MSDTDTTEHDAGVRPDATEAGVRPDGGAAGVGPDGGAAGVGPDGGAAGVGPDGGAAGVGPDASEAGERADAGEATPEMAGDGGEAGAGADAGEATHEMAGDGGEAGAGADESGAGADESGAGADEAGAGADEVGARADEAGAGADEVDEDVDGEDDASDVKEGASDDLEEKLVAEGEIAGDYLEELLDLLDFDGDIDLDVEGDRAVVSIDGGEDLSKLVGRNGEVLDALQELTRLAVHQKTGERSRLMLDIASWRRRRREELAALGAKVARRVLESGEREQLSPMTPFERKIVHDAVAGVDGVRSESEGVEPARRVVVLLD